MLRVQEGYQRTGLGTRLLVNAINFYRRLDVRCIRLSAGLSSGGSVWPKFGFRPITAAVWRSIHPKIRENLAQIDTSTKMRCQTHLGTDLYGIVSMILSDPNPKRIWVLSDLDKLVPPDIKLGARLLSETRWKGILDFEDKDAFSRLETYLDKKGYRL